jgi:hypothetical protein
LKFCLAFVFSRSTIDVSTCISSAILGRKLSMCSFHKLCCCCYICNLKVVFNWCQVLAMNEFDLYLKRCRLCACEHRLGVNISGNEGVMLDLKSKIKMYLSINVS